MCPQGSVWDLFQAIKSALVPPFDSFAPRQPEQGKEWCN